MGNEGKHVTVHRARVEQRPQIIEPNCRREDPTRIFITEGDVQLCIDVPRIVAKLGPVLARKAIANKTGKARSMSGLIEARVITRSTREEAR